MTRHVLIINITRMGDLIQTVPLIQRLHAEWPDVAVDLLVDRRFAKTAQLLPGIRHVHSPDFQVLTDEARVQAKDVVSLLRDLERWVLPLRDVRYDRLINLTFNRRSGLLAAYLGARDTRGVTASPDGTTVVRDPWMAYFADLHRYRRENRFNLVDLYALGGSGHGPFAPLRLSIDRESAEWAARFLHDRRATGSIIAVQVGASEPIKAWRPALYGRTLAAIARQQPASFVLIGTTAETAAVDEAVEAYRAAGAPGTLIRAVDRTTIPQLVALLARCRLLLTNDTGPMHLAVGAGIPVVNLSVGHVDFHETGPYGEGHWVIQPDLACAPCGFDAICPHHACKDRIMPESVAALCLHVLGGKPLPHEWPGARVYRSTIDEDGLVAYQHQAGPAEPEGDRPARFWRRFWFETFTGRPSALPSPSAGPWREEALEALYGLQAKAQAIVAHAEAIVHTVRRCPLPVEDVQVRQRRLAGLRQEVSEFALRSPWCAPMTVALVRDLHNSEAVDLVPMAEQQLTAYRVWRTRIDMVMQRLRALGESEAFEGDRDGRCRMIQIQTRGCHAH